MVVDGIPFLLLFLAFVAHVLLKDGFAVQPETGEIAMEPFKYFNNLIAMPYLLVLFLMGVVGVLFGLGKSIFCKTYTRGIWFAGVGTVLTVLALLLTVGYNHTARILPFYSRLAEFADSIQQLFQPVYLADHGLRVCACSFCAGLHCVRMACHRSQTDY